MSKRWPTQLDQLTDAIDPEDELLAEGHEPPHHMSITGAVDQAVSDGLKARDADTEQIPGEDDVLRAGDPDADPLDNEYAGDEAAGQCNASPDDNDVDAMGRLYGVSETDRDGLVLGDDLIAPRDRDRWENNPASKDPE